MKKIFTLFAGLFMGMLTLQAQDAGASESAPAAPGCCSDLKIGVSANAGMVIPDFIRLNTRLRVNGMRPIPSDHVMGTTMLWVQTGRLRYALEVGNGKRTSLFPQDTLDRVNLNHRVLGIQAGYVVLKDQRFDVTVFGALYDHRTRVEYLHYNEQDVAFDDYLASKQKTVVLNHNIATIRFGAACDYYFTISNAGKSFNLPLTCGLSAHAGTPLTRGTWNYDTNYELRDPLKVNPMVWSLSARVGMILKAK
jgi:hypothetical protein